MEEKQSQSIASKSISALKWNYLGRLISMSLQFSIGIVLARMLGPEPFGLIAIALFIQSLGNLFAEGGLGSALIRSPEISDLDIRSVFWTQILIGLGISTMVAVSAPLISLFFNEPNATPVITVMAFSFLLQAFGQTSSALIRRNLDFKKIQIISLISYCIGYLGVGLPMALYDFGVWSLVTAQLTQTAINAAFTYALRAHSILPLVNPKHCRFLRFGAAITLNNITSWAISNLDTAIVGRYFPTEILGYYNRVFSLVNMPMHAVVSSLQSVLFSAYSKTQNNQLVLRRTLVSAITVMALLFFPIYASIAAVPDLIITVLYGNKWQAAAPFMVPLSLALAVNATLAMCGPLLSAIGKPHIELKAQLSTLLIGTPSLIFAARESAIALAWTVLATYLLRLVLLTTSTLHAVGERRYRLATILIAPSIIAGILYWICGYLDTSNLLTGLPKFSKLIVIASVCSVVYPLLLVLSRRLIFRGALREFMLSTGDKFPKSIFRLTGVSA